MLYCLYDHLYENHFLLDLPVVDRQRYQKLEQIAETDHSIIYRAKDTITNALVAIKELKGNYSDPKYQRDFVCKISNMALLQHPAILSIIGCNLSPPFLIVLPFCPKGSLTNYIRQEQPDAAIKIPEYDITMKAKICLGVASAISFLHSQGTAHHNIKPDNVLINETHEPLLKDYKTSISTNLDAVSSSNDTPLFMAPEQFESDVQLLLKNVQKCDIYSFGMLMYCIFNSTDNPYPGITSVYYLANHVIRGNRPQFPGDDLDLSHTTQQRRFISTIIRNLIEQCWSNSPEERPSFDQILETLKNPSIYGPNLNREDFNEYVAKLGLSISIPSQSHEEEEEVEDITALYQEAISFIEGTSDRGQDIQRGINLLNQICNENNYVPALLYMNKLIWEGKHVERDLKLANQYLKGAADQGDLGAISNYTKYLSDRIRKVTKSGSTTDRKMIGKLAKEKRFYLYKGVELGDPQSMAVLAREYVRTHKYEDAVPLLEDSIRISSNPIAIFIMGEMYEKGLYYHVDIDKAISYYRTSAALLYKPAFLALERLGVTHNPHFSSHDEFIQTQDVENYQSLGRGINQIRGRGSNQARYRGNQSNRGCRINQISDEDDDINDEFIQTQDVENYQNKGRGNNQIRGRGNNQIRGSGNQSNRGCRSNQISNEGDDINNEFIQTQDVDNYQSRGRSRQFNLSHKKQSSRGRDNKYNPDGRRNQIGASPVQQTTSMITTELTSQDDDFDQDGVNRGNSNCIGRET